MAPSALASALTMLEMGRLTSKIDVRLLIGIGAVGTALAMFQLAHITPQSGESNLSYPLIWRGVFTIFMYLPLNLAALSSLPKPAILLADITPYKPETMQRLSALAETLQSRGMDSTTAKQQALAVLSQTVDM